MKEWRTTAENRKHKKSAVHYTPHAAVHNERCELCRHFVAMSKECRKVVGSISPKGWCELFSHR